jgi:hypothetical protein
VAKPTLENKNLLLIAGHSATGKTASLRNLKNQEGIVYLNCECNKGLPFKNSFKYATITDIETFEACLTASISSDECHTIIIDTLDFLLEMFVSQKINHPDIEDTRSAWGDYTEFFKRIMKEHVASTNKRIIFLAHLTESIDENTGQKVASIPCSAKLSKMGIPSFFSHIVCTHKHSVDYLKQFDNPLLNITEDDEDVGFKYVFQTRPTKDTRHLPIRGPMGMWEKQETFIDNCAEAVCTKVEEYFA